jgi:hypothetical protein
MAGHWRRFFQEAGWLADIIWWVQSPLDLFKSEPRDPNRPRRRVHIDKDGNVLRVEEPDDKSSG